MNEDATRQTGHREFLWLAGGIAVLLVVALIILLLVVTFYRSGPSRGHPQATPTPAATASP